MHIFQPYGPCKMTLHHFLSFFLSFCPVSPHQYLLCLHNNKPDSSQIREKKIQHCMTECCVWGAFGSVEENLSADIPCLFSNRFHWICVWQFLKSCSWQTKFEMVLCNVLWLLLKYPWEWEETGKKTHFPPFPNSFPYRICNCSLYSNKTTESWDTKLSEPEERRKK